MLYGIHYKLEDCNYYFELRAYCFQKCQSTLREVLERRIRFPVNGKITIEIKETCSQLLQK